MKEVNVFCAWKDKLEEMAELNRTGQGLGMQKDVAETPENDGDIEETKGLLKVSDRSKGIAKNKTGSRLKKLGGDDDEDDD